MRHRLLSPPPAFIVVVLFAAVALPARLLAQSSPPITLLEDPGRIKIVYGGDCGNSHANGPQAAVELTDRLDAPPWANQATVFLNGWSAEYLRGDQHLGEVKVVVADIALSRSVLQWKAYGVLADRDAGSPHQLCHCYTALFWNDSQIDAATFHENGSYDTTTGECKGNMNFGEQKDGIRPMLILDSYVLGKAFTAARHVAILPRGFDFAFLPFGKADNHVLQIAADLDHGEGMIVYPRGYGHLPAPAAASKASQVGQGYVSWQTRAILKDDSGSPNFRFWEHFSALAGDDVEVIQTPYSAPPLLHDNPSQVSHGGGVTTESHVIENVPYEYAVPVLTGWNLEYDYPSDQHVLRLGAWLHDIEYTKKPNDLAGRLSYKVSSVLTDSDGNGHRFTHKVHIVGIKATSALPDLMPVPQGGDGSYCTQAGTKTLSVTIRNQGKVDAPASTTTVEFSPVLSVDIPTPAVPAGQEVRVSVAVPGQCYTPNCRFRIRVDSKLAIKEANEYNNDAAGECRG